MIAGICALILALHRARSELGTIHGLQDMVRALDALTDGGKLLSVRDDDFGFGVAHFAGAGW